MGVSGKTSTTAGERKSAAEEFRKMLKGPGRKSRKRKPKPSRVPSRSRKPERDQMQKPKASQRGRKRSVTRRRRK
jgi:hypothetical protein